MGPVSDANTISRVVTQYAPCACSPLLKISAVSQPYNPNGGTAVWTTYTYDGMGRTVSVTAPDGASHTQTAYNGNSTKVTDPAGKWKTSTSDVFGNLTVVTEPDPGDPNNTWLTNYSYNAFNQLLSVSMPRPTGTQTRSFAYTGADMTSATNPENGTVTYSYDGAHRVVSRTDAMGQVTQYDRDSYGRVTEVRYYDASQDERVSERADYTYDAGTNGVGHLTGVSFHGGIVGANQAYTLSYGYSVVGRMTSQQLVVVTNPYWRPTITFTAAYTWDNEGRMTAQQNPTVMLPYQWYPAVLGTEGFSYDTDGRMTGMTLDTGNGPMPYASATYGPAGEMQSLSYLGMTEQRSYNSLLQMTHQWVSGYMDMTYNYSTTANNGRITGSVDAVANETTSYTYDALNRLTGAANGQWTAGYTYDGFGNLTSKTGTGGAPYMAAVTYDANNHQTGMGYDANGNQAVGFYNVENRLQSIREHAIRV